MSKNESQKSVSMERSDRCKEATAKAGTEAGPKTKPDHQDVVHILTLACADRPGIVASVAGIITECNGNIIESSQFGDPDTGRFFMRVKFAADKTCGKSSFLSAFTDVGEKYEMQWHLHDADHKLKTLIMASKTDHCLNDLIYRTEMGSLPLEIVGIVSNHHDVQPIADINNIAFHHLPVTKENKDQQEQALRKLITAGGAELIVLARYMQILSDKFSKDYYGAIINIHHSFLPGFKGAKPYHRAHQRGVKLIGATAHYVTPELDEGPIIEQETERVSHAMGPKDLITAGRDIERRVLSKAVKYHAEQRVLINNGRTVVFT